MDSKVTLVAETLNPDKGGIPRYSYEISKTKGIKNVIDFSKSISNDGIVNKYLNKLYRRKKALEARINDIEKVVHFTQPEVMFKSKILEGRKTVLTVHDLAVFGTMKVKGLYGVVRGVAFRSQFRFDVNKADIIMANSTQTAEELVSVLNVDRRKIVVDDLGIDSKFRKMNVKKINAIGYFGGFNRRKRVEKLILDFLGSEIGNKIPLVIYGDSEDYPGLKAKYGSSPNIIFKGKIPESEIVKTINSFNYFVYPSSYEGFGLPLLEAVACGVPSFVYRDAVIPKEVKKYAVEIEKMDDLLGYDYKKLAGDFNKLANKAKKEFSWERNRKILSEQYLKLSR